MPSRRGKQKPAKRVVALERVCCFGIKMDASESQSAQLTAMRTTEFKLYPSKSQAKKLDEWMSHCCFLFNKFLDQRKKAYSRRKESISYNDQCKTLTEWRRASESTRSVPADFQRDSLRRVDRGMKAFFRRCKSGEKPGFPRFKSAARYNSIECLAAGSYIKTNAIRIPGIGCVRARGQFGDHPVQKLLRVIRRASGLYAQVLVEHKSIRHLPENNLEVGFDLGLESFLVSNAGEKIENPRHLKRSSRKLRRAQKRVSRCKKGSNGRKKSVRMLARIHEKVSRQRTGFCHRVSRDVVNRYQRIAVEDLNIKGLSKGMLAKHVLDACWGKFISLLTYKAENAGRQLVKVDPRGTSQECPNCGCIRKKQLNEREHNCSSCGLRCHRDHASAQVVLQRAFRPVSEEHVRLALTSKLSETRS